MKSRRILAVLAACTAVTFTGCGVVTVVPIGEEASYTGKQEFDSAAESQGDWGAVVADISDKAQDLSELLNGEVAQGKKDSKEQEKSKNTIQTPRNII